MTDNYARIVQDNLHRLYAGSTKDLAARLPGRQSEGRFIFEAFGDTCEIAPDGITLGGVPPLSVVGILISLYALYSCSDSPVLLPFKAFKEFPDAAPYVGAFTTHTEQLLVPHVDKIRPAVSKIIGALNGKEDTIADGGDFSFIVHPFPKIALRYIFYEADEEFPASATCLFSNNANRFLPMDGLADVGEYTSRKIMDLVK
jgi:hypothetical protein